jgi:hypothetical protein
VLNVHAPIEDKIDDMKDRFYEELEQVFHKFPRYHIKILLRYFNAKIGREYIFKSTIGNESLHVISNDNGVKSSQVCHIKRSYCQKYDVSTPTG